MNLTQLFEGCIIRENKAPDTIVPTGLALDSRLVVPGDVFFAIPGARCDGLEFVPAAMEKGAVLAVCEGRPTEDVPYLLVDDVHETLAAAAAHWFGRPAEQMRMIGVTGTNGKTTVTHIVKGLLESAPPENSRKVGMIGTIQNATGGRVTEAVRTTPDALSLQKLLAEMVREGCTHCVMEVSSHALLQKRAWGIRFAMGVFTNLSQDHLDYHRTMEDYFEAKALLFDQCDVGIVNLDDPYGKRLAENKKLNTITFSADRDEADVVAKNIRQKGTRVEFEAVTMSEIARVEWCTPGRFSVYNALAAVCCGLIEGLSLKDVATAIKAVEPVKGRMETLRGPGGAPVILDYAHTPDALENVLTTIREFHPGRVITVMGCGGDRDRAKRPLMGEMAARYSHVLIVTSDNPRTEAPQSIIDDIMTGIVRPKCQVLTIVDRHAAIHRALDEVRPGDLVLIAGKGHEREQEIMGMKVPFDERDVVREYLHNR